MEIGVGASDEEHGPDIGGCHHADVDRLFEWGFAPQGPADPVRCGKTDIELVGVQAVGTGDTGPVEGKNLDIVGRPQEIRDGLALHMESSARLARPDPDFRHSFLAVLSVSCLAFPSGIATAAIPPPVLSVSIAALHAAAKCLEI